MQVELLIPSMNPNCLLLYGTHPTKNIPLSLVQNPFSYGKKKLRLPSSIMALNPHAIVDLNLFVSILDFVGNRPGMNLQKKATFWKI